MGLPSLDLNLDLAKIWRLTLDSKGFKVVLKDSEANGLDTALSSRRIVEVLWHVRDGITEIKILEAKYNDRDYVSLIFMSSGTRDERHLLSGILEILIAAGARQQVSSLPLGSSDCFDELLFFPPGGSSNGVKELARLLESGSYNEANSLATELLREHLEPRVEAYVCILRARAYIELGRALEAVTYLSTAIELGHFHITGYRMRSSAYQTLGDTERARHDTYRADELAKRTKS
jgi:hypothetical protein